TRNRAAAELQILGAACGPRSRAALARSGQAGRGTRSFRFAEIGIAAAIHEAVAIACAGVSLAAANRYHLGTRARDLSYPRMVEDSHRLSKVGRRLHRAQTGKRVDKGMSTSKGVAPNGGGIAPDFVPPQRMDKGLGRISLP